MTEFEEGDLVQLRGSGGPYGPAMSVQEIDGERATCMWFDEKAVLHEQNFLVRTLVKYQPTYGVSGS